MKTLPVRQILFYTTAGFIVILLGALGGWYFFLQKQSSAIATLNSGLGLGNATPSFENPSGSTANNIASTLGNSWTPLVTSNSSVSSLLHEVDAAPVAGAGFVASATSSQATLEYIERGNGYVFYFDTASSASARITDTLATKIYEAQVASNGAVLERSLDNSGNITTFAGVIASTTSATSTSVSLKGVYLPQNILRSVPLPDGNVFYLVQNDTGGVDGVTAQWNGTKTKDVFTSPIAGWNVITPDDGSIFLLERPADGIPGYAYQLNMKNGSLAPVVRAVPGLTLLPKSGSQALLYGASAGDGTALYAQSSTQSTPVPLSIETVADKCVWLPGKSLIAYCAVPQTAPSGNFLDDWYKGVVHTTDSWWKIDASSGSSTQIYSPVTTDHVSLDVIDPKIDPSGNYIAFINNTDQSLWILKIPQ